jgi:hypothetical protein
MKCGIEAHGCDCCSGDGGQQRTAQRVSDGVTKTGLERTHSETLTVVLGVADCLDCWALNDEHAALLRIFL